MANISLQFSLMPNNQILTFYKILLKTKHDCKIENNVIAWDNSVFIPLYNKQIITTDDIAQTLKNIIQYENIYICAINFSNDAYSLINKLDKKIILLNEKDTFYIMKKRDFYPENIVKIKITNKIKFSQLKDIIFIKSNAKHYFFSGLIILITSFYIKHNIYYLIFATILFIFSGISFFKHNVKPSSEIENL